MTFSQQLLPIKLPECECVFFLLSGVAAVVEVRNPLETGHGFYVILVVFVFLVARVNSGVCTLQSAQLKQRPLQVCRHTSVPQLPTGQQQHGPSDPLQEVQGSTLMDEGASFEVSSP